MDNRAAEQQRCNLSALMAAQSSSVPSLPPPRPKSPPEYPDLYGRRREAAKVQMLEREISFLEVGLSLSLSLCRRLQLGFTRHKLDVSQITIIDHYGVLKTFSWVLAFESVPHLPLFFEKFDSLLLLCV